MTMHFSYHQGCTTQSEHPKTFLSKVFKDFCQLIESHTQQIKELNAGGETARMIINQMKRIVNSTLPDANPHAIVGGILRYAAEPYADYTKTQSKERNRGIGETIIKKNKGMYLTSLGGFLSEQQLNTTLATYTLDLKDIDYTIDSTSPYQFSYTHGNRMHGVGVARSTGDHFTIEKDEIGMQDFAADLKGEYFTRDIHNLTSSHEAEYITMSESDYRPNHHIPCIKGISQLLGGI